MAETRCCRRRSSGSQSHTRVLTREGEDSTIAWRFWVCWKKLIASFPCGDISFTDISINRSGKRIVQLQASLALVQDAGRFAKKTPEDPFGRKPFTHQALDGLNNLSSNTKNFLTSKTKLSELAQKYELQKVVRWSPRKVKHISSLQTPVLQR